MAPQPNRVQVAAGVLDEIGVPELQSRQRQKLLTSERMTEIYLARIEAIDRNGAGGYVLSSKSIQMRSPSLARWMLSLKQRARARRCMACPF